MQASTRALVVMAVMSAGCGPDEGTTTKATTGKDETGDGSGSATATDPGSDSDPTEGEPTEGEPGPGSAQVDILFVIDNSGSMADEQALLVENIAAFVDVLDGYQADYRIAVTTTDSGNPRCPSSIYKPEGGAFVRSSCLDRVAQDEFRFGEDDYAYACTDLCARTDADITVKPTTTEQDDTPAPRAWIEFTGGQGNIEGMTAVEALRCYLPQGVAGCGFESHLESMYRALVGSQDPASTTNHGFLREAAQLAVIIVSDEADCSFNPDTTEIFTTNKVFWNNPEDPAPTSALCWRAGVACTGGPGTYSECHAENYDDAGSPGASDDEAVLQPVGKYVDFLKQIKGPGSRVSVALIAGVPPGYESYDSEIPYEDSPDSTIQGNLGIGPGCVLGQAIAVPPVRERELAEAMATPGERNLYSICQQDYSGALKAIAEDIRDGG